MRTGLTAALVAALAAAASSNEAAAQEQAAERLVSTRFAPLARPALAADEAAPILKTPPPGLAPGARSADDGPRFVLNGVDFVIEGPSPFAEGYLRDAAAPLIGAEVALGDLETFRRLLSEELVKAGYIGAAVAIPEQRIENGVVLFRVVVGRLAAVFIAGERVGDGIGELAPDYIGRRVSGDPNAALNVNVLQERLRALIADRNVERVSADLRPTGRAGEVELAIDAVARRPWDLAIALSNDGASASGELKGSLSGAYRNLTGHGDQMTLDLFVTEGAVGAAATLDGPLPNGSLTPFLRLEAQRARVIEAPLDELDIESRVFSVSAGLAAPLLSNSAEYLGVTAQLALKRTETTLSDQPFAFSPGVGEDGVTRLTVLTVAQDYSRRDVDWALAARSSFNIGLSVLGASSDDGADDAPDERFLSWVGQVQGVYAATDDLTLIARAQAQFADGPLLPAADVAIGGRSSVRGFREGAVVSDQAVAGTLQADFVLGDLTLPGVDGSVASPVALSPFVDAGRAWNIGEGGSSTLVGVGAGLSWSPFPQVDLLIE
ncbi:MAG: ShlB/FhaC/HecB family hemolysin secretion/activation protein, partial [Pseudomonadota bacterium]